MSSDNHPVFCRSTSDIPTGDHYAFLVLVRTDIPADTRSINFPGHGYPAHVVSTWEYIVYPNRASWEKEVKAHASSNQHVPIKVVRPSIKMTVVIDEEADD